MKVEVGSVVKWESSGGARTGVVSGIILAPVASGQIQPWLYINTLTEQGISKHRMVLLASDAYVKMLKLELI